MSIAFGGGTQNGKGFRECPGQVLGMLEPRDFILFGPLGDHHAKFIVALPCGHTTAIADEIKKWILKRVI